MFRLWLWYAVSYTISRQPKHIQARSHGTWERKNHFLCYNCKHIYISFNWVQFGAQHMFCLRFLHPLISSHLESYTGMKVAGGCFRLDSSCWNAFKQGLLIGMSVI
jgi:hypothetical protein